MGVASMATLMLTHPNEFRTLVQFWLWHEPKRDITSVKEFETSGWDRKTMRRCWEFLDMTGRSFSAVTKELDGDLARVVRLIYFFIHLLSGLSNRQADEIDVKRYVYSTSSCEGWTRSRTT